MKTLQDIILETVNKPKSKDEQDFIDKHEVEKKDHPEAEESQFVAKTKKKKRPADYDNGQDEKVYESRIARFSDFIMSEENLVEAKFAPGNMKLKDGSSVKVTREDVKALSALFDELNGSNKKKMKERMMEDKKGFEEILKFAKEAM